MINKNDLARGGGDELMYDHFIQLMLSIILMFILLFFMDTPISFLSFIYNG